MRTGILIVAGILSSFYMNVHAQNAISVHDMKLSYVNNLDRKKGNKISGNCVDAHNDTIYLHGDSTKSGGFFGTFSENGQRDKHIQIESSYLYISPIPVKDSEIFLFSLKDIITLASDTAGGSEGSSQRGLSFFIRTSHKGSLYMHMDNVNLQGVLPSESSIRIVINGKSTTYKRETNKVLQFDLRKGENSIYIDLYDGTAKRSNAGPESSEYWLLTSDLGFEVTP